MTVGTMVTIIIIVVIRRVYALEKVNDRIICVPTTLQLV